MKTSQYVYHHHGYFSDSSSEQESKDLAILIWISLIRNAGCTYDPSTITTLMTERASINGMAFPKENTDEPDYVIQVSGSVNIP